MGKLEEDPSGDVWRGRWRNQYELARGMGLVQDDVACDQADGCVGRGKFALDDRDDPALADTHISIIRFDAKHTDPQYLCFYCQSMLGTAQLRYLEMQIKGTPEIYSDQLNRLRILKTELKTQQKIAEQIQGELSKRDAVVASIKEQRRQIDEVVRSILTSADLQPAAGVA